MFVVVIVRSMFEYKVLEEETKSDFAFEVYADTIEELFEGAAHATMSAMIKKETLNTKHEWEFQLEASDLSALLYDFLSELVFIKDTEGLLFKSFKLEISNENGEYKLLCVAKGDYIDVKTQELYTDVKAITYYEFIVEERENKWYCHVLIDL